MSIKLPKKVRRGHAVDMGGGAKIPYEELDDKPKRLSLRRKPKTTKPKHDLFCECSKCLPSFEQYAAKISTRKYVRKPRPKRARKVRDDKS